MASVLSLIAAITPTMRRCAALMISASIFAALGSKADELAAHQHGRGAVNLVVEDSALWIELEAPGADIVGFERAPQGAAEVAAVEAAKKRLSDPLDLFAISPEAGCELESAHVDIERGDGHEPESDDGNHDEGEAQTHSVFHAEYKLTCAEPERITTVAATYFDYFPRAHELSVYVIVGDDQSYHDVDRDNPRIPLRGR